MTRQFNDDTHRYYAGDVEYLNFSYFWELYTEIYLPRLPQIEEGSRYGKEMHKILEDNIFVKSKNYTHPSIYFVEDYLNNWATKNICDENLCNHSCRKGSCSNDIEKEMKLWNDDLLIAGTIDLIFGQREKIILLADYKTSKEIDRERCTFQLAFYDLLLCNSYMESNVKQEYSQNREYIIFHLPIDDNEYIAYKDLYSVINISKEDIEKAKNIILEYLQDRKTRREKTLEKLDLDDFYNLEELQLVESQISKLETRSKILKDLLFESMKSKDIHTIDYKEMKVTSIKSKDSVRVTIKRS